jgi:hypothetical protein
VHGTKIRLYVAPSDLWVLQVKNVVNKKWNTVRATTCFSSGLHTWEVHVDRCISKNIFIGVVTAESALDNYVGSDRFGWGYLANKAVWHGKSKIRTYGELFKEGDTIGIHLDLDLGTLLFSRNGRDLGVAVEGLKGGEYRSHPPKATCNSMTETPLSFALRSMPPVTR